jgi:hypothetical protein
MEKSRVYISSSKNQGKMIKSIHSRQLYSPFRSSRVKKVLNSTSQPPIIHNLYKFTPIRSRISPTRGYVSDLQPLKSLITPDTSSDTVQITSNFRFPEDSMNFVRTPSTVKEEEPLIDDTIDESLFHYFNHEVNNRYSNKTPSPAIFTPDIKFIHRYKNSLQHEIAPYKSETPEIPTRKKDTKPEIKLPAVEHKLKPIKGGKNRSPSPQDTINKTKNRLDSLQKTKPVQVFRKYKF